MTFSQECVIPVERERLWDFMMEVPRVARCVPGVEAVEAMDSGAYRGSLKVQVGPIRLALEGVITVEEQDRNAWRARMRAEANDRRLGGGIRARLGLTLVPGDSGTHLKIDYRSRDSRQDRGVRPARHQEKGRYAPRGVRPKPPIRARGVRCSMHRGVTSWNGSCECSSWDWV